jgi:hypothetical protein
LFICLSFVFPVAAGSKLEVRTGSRQEVRVNQRPPLFPLLLDIFNDQSHSSGLEAASGSRAMGGGSRRKYSRAGPGRTARGILSATPWRNATARFHGL